MSKPILARDSAVTKNKDNNHNFFIQTYRSAFSRKFVTAKPDQTGRETLRTIAITQVVMKITTQTCKQPSTNQKHIKQQTPVVIVLRKKILPRINSKSANSLTGITAKILTCTKEYIKPESIKWLHNKRKKSINIHQRETMTSFFRKSYAACDVRIQDRPGEQILWPSSTHL